MNIVVTMVLGGLWHGAAWTFVFWGALHGVGQAIGAWKRTHLPERTETPLLLWGAAAVHVRAGLHGMGLLPSRLHGHGVLAPRPAHHGVDDPTELVTPLVIGTIALMLALQYAPREPGLLLQERISRWRPVPMGLAGAASLFVITTLGPQGVAPFIYFQF